jgi:hypothetical protein
MELEGLEVLGEVRHGGSVCRLGAEGINGYHKHRKAAEAESMGRVGNKEGVVVVGLR